MRAFPKLRVFVVGDIMVDRYLVGDCERISPEAPVQVVRLNRTTSSLGGAANVAANLAELQVSVELVGQVGRDSAGDALRELCAKHGIGTTGVRAPEGAKTIVKSRILAGDRQLLRVDEEDCAPSPDSESDATLTAILRLCDLAEPDALILSDYAKGVCTPYLCQAVIRACAARGIAVYVDPKGRDYEKYRGAQGVTPNRSEMAEIASAKGWPADDLLGAAQRLFQELQFDFVALKLGAGGIALVSADGVTRVPTVAKEVYDVSGAGDTAIATMVAGLSAGLDRAEAVMLANLAASEVVAHIGSRPIHRDELLLAIQTHNRGMPGRKRYEVEDLVSIVDLWKRQGLAVGFTNGCFDLLHAGHVQLLEDAASRVDRLIVGVNSDDSVRRLKGPDRPLMSEEHRVTVLSALEAVDAVVVFDTDTPQALIELILPQVLIKGGDYSRGEVVGGDVVESHGGRVDLIPLVPGVSTSHLAAAIEKL